MMKPSGKNSNQSRFTKPALTIFAVITLLALAYFGYTSLFPPKTPCESILEQAAGIRIKIDFMKKDGKSVLDPNKINKIATQSRQAALNLKTCCLLFHRDHITHDEYLACQGDFKNLEMAIGRVSDLVAEIQQASREEKTELAEYKTERVNQAVEGIEKSAGHLRERMNHYSRRSSESKGTQGQAAQASILTETEPNDDYHQATQISIAATAGELSPIEMKPGQTYRGELGGNDVEDWFQFDIPPGYILSMAFTPDPEAQAMNFALRSYERNEIWYLEKVAPGVTQSQRVVMNTISGGRYYLTVYEGRGPYTFEITAESQNDANSGTDAADMISKALEIKPDRSYNGQLGGLDEQDWYRFHIAGGNILEFAFTPAPESSPIIFSLLNAAHEEIWRSGEVLPGVTKPARLLVNSNSEGLYFIKAFNGGGIYRFDLATGNQNDGGSGTDAGDKIANAVEIKPGLSFHGELGGLDAEDWYMFDPKNGQKLNFTCAEESEPMKLALHALDQGAVGYSAEILPGVTQSFEIPADVHPPYFIRIFDGSGKYSIVLR